MKRWFVSVAGWLVAVVKNRINLFDIWLYEKRDSDSPYMLEQLLEQHQPRLPKILNQYFDPVELLKMRYKGKGYTVRHVDQVLGNAQYGLLDPSQQWIDTPLDPQQRMYIKNLLVANKLMEQGIVRYENMSDDPLYKIRNSWAFDTVPASRQKVQSLWPMPTLLHLSRWLRALRQWCKAKIADARFELKCQYLLLKKKLRRK